MATFLNPQGVEVSQADAMIGGTLRPGFKKILSDGESIHMNIMMMDSLRAPTINRPTDRVRDMATAKLMSSARYNGCTAMIEAADSDNPSPPSFKAHSPGDVSAIIRNARYA